MNSPYEIFPVLKVKNVFYFNLLGEIVLEEWEKRELKKKRYFATSIFLPLRPSFLLFYYNHFFYAFYFIFLLFIQLFIH